MTWKTFLFFFEQRRSRPLKCGKCAPERAPPPLTHKGCRTDWKKHKWDNFALPHRRNTNAQDSCVFRTSSTCWMIIPESCLACVALNFYANDVCLKTSKRRFTCQHNIMTHYWRGLSNKSSKISSRTITQGTQRDLKQEKKIFQCKWMQFLSSL